MEKTIRSYFNVVGQYCDALNDSGLNINFYVNKIDDYVKAVEEKYYRYKNQYLKNDVEYLDRHKMAAILVVCGIECKIVDSGEMSKKIEDDKIDICTQKILLLAAFDYLLEIMNLKIDDKKDDSIKKISEFDFPKAFTCPTTFVDIMSRTLYYAEKEYKLNEMELAEKFFLLEYISILKKFPNESDKYFSLFEE